MRWLLLKDLRLLRRSPLQAGMLILYPALIAVLVGFAISRDQSDPRVALVSPPPGERVQIGDQDLNIDARARLCARVECVDVESRAEAVEKVRDGEALAALVVPSDIAAQVRSLATLNPKRPRVEVIVDRSDPAKARFVDDRISSLLAQANLLIARRIATVGGRYLELVLNGGEFEFLGQRFPILGLRASASILTSLRPAVPPGALRDSLDQVIRFTTLARDNLDVAPPLLRAVAEPIEVKRSSVSGAGPPLDLFAVAVAATVTLMFVVLLLVSGSLALEREENAFARLTRGLVGRAELVAEKVALGMGVGLVVTLLLLAALSPFVALDWGRFGLWLVAIAAGGAGFAAAGAALGAATKEVRAASLVAFMVSLPVIFLSLVPSGAVGPGLYDAIRVVAALFPFKPALNATTAALDSAGPSLGTALLHLAALVAAYGLLARLALRRFATA